MTFRVCCEMILVAADEMSLKRAEVSERLISDLLYSTGQVYIYLSSFISRSLRGRRHNFLFFFAISEHFRLVPGPYLDQIGRATLIRRTRYDPV